MPPNVRVLQQQDRQATLELATAGAYPVQVEITDSRGNRSQVQTTLTTLEPIPYELTLDIRPSNTHNRAPLDVTLYVDATGGHPSDRPHQYHFYQDEKLITEGTGNYARFIGLPVGEHTLRAEIESTYGARASKETRLTVVANSRRSARWRRSRAWRQVLPADRRLQRSRWADGGVSLDGQWYAGGVERYYAVGDPSGRAVAGGGIDGGG